MHVSTQQHPRATQGGDSAIMADAESYRAGGLRPHRHRQHVRSAGWVASAAGPDED